MYARLATFEGDPANVDDVIALLRERTASDPPPGLENAKFLMLVDRDSGKGYGLTLFATEDDRRRGDETLNADTTPTGGKRLSVEFLDVPVHTLG